MKGILGKKIGMTQVFDKSGKLVPVTVIEVNPNVVTQVRTKENDGYEAVQFGYENVREKVSNKAKIGHTNKANTAPKRFLKEIRGVNISDYTLGQEVSADLFEAGEIVDVTGISKGKGFQGVIKRHNQSRGPMSHGSKHHRLMGSLGTMEPKRVFKGKAYPGHMGDEQITIQNLEIIKVDALENYILVKGSVPGAKKSFVIIKSAVKTDDKKEAFDLISYKVETPVEEKVIEETVIDVKEVTEIEVEVTTEVEETVTPEATEATNE